MGFSSFDDMISKLTAATPQRNTSQWLKVVPSITPGALFWWSTWTWTGDPPAGTNAGTALNAYACTDSSQGAIKHGGNVMPLTKHLTKIAAQTPGFTITPIILMLYDRLLYYPAIPIGVDTNINLVNGTSLPRYTTGEGVRAWFENDTSTGGTATWTYGTNGYTNSNGDTGRQHSVTVKSASGTKTSIIPHSGTAANNSWNPFLPMQVGDTGIRSVQSVRPNSTVHGVGSTFTLVLGKPLATIPLPSQHVWMERDFVCHLASLERIYDGACLSYLIYMGVAATNALPIMGDIEVAWG
jgi:hypothetical protein